MNDIKKGLLQVTPNLENSKQKVKLGVLQGPTRKRPFIPLFVTACVVLLASFFILSEFKTTNYVQGNSPEILAMYGVLDEGDYSENYKHDIIISRYGQLQHIKLKQKELSARINALENELPKTIERALKQNGISKQAYKEQYLTLRAQVSLIYEKLLPSYEEQYPQFPQVVLKNLITVDATKAVADKPFKLYAAINFDAIVLYETNNARILTLLDEKDWPEEQLLIMPKNDEHTFNVGDSVIVEQGIINGFQSEAGYKQTVVAESIKKIATPAVFPAKFRSNNSISTFFAQLDWQQTQQTTEPIMQIETNDGLYNVWRNKQDLIIGDDSQQAIISYASLKKWGEQLINTK